MKEMIGVPVLTPLRDCVPKPAQQSKGVVCYAKVSVHDDKVRRCSYSELARSTLIYLWDSDARHFAALPRVVYVNLE